MAAVKTMVTTMIYSNDDNMGSECKVMACVRRRSKYGNEIRVQSKVQQFWLYLVLTLYVRGGSAVVRASNIVSEIVIAGSLGASSRSQ